ncbi:MAG: GntR family transcriptional regulator [Acholeplasmataceae bacterium]
MSIQISIYSEIPIYEQIKDQIRKAIISNQYKSNEMLPSIRTLSKELQVGIVTVKRAYDDLVIEGYIINQSAKGYYILPINQKIIEKQYRGKIEDLFQKVSALQDEANLSDELVEKLWRQRKGVGK